MCKRIAWLTVALLTVWAVGGLPPSAWADNYVPQGPFVAPASVGRIPTPTEVPGKEYTDFLDKDAGNPPVLTPLQDLAWDGVGGTANSFNYSGSFQLVPDEQIEDPGREIDAMANSSDVLFSQVISNLSALLVSAETDPIAPIHAVHPGTGAVSVWATAAQVDHHGVNDLNALEVWGPEGLDDSNRFSLLGDPLGVAVWAYVGGVSSPFVTTAQIGAAIGLPTDLVGQLDLDALMTFNEQLLFSIRPLGPFDGGEIWHWDGANPATFLNHGGRVWDTALNVTALLGHENVDGLESVGAIPEPAAVNLLALGGLILLRRPRR